jgi:molybdenum cofactor cytidylyltransferase
MKDCSAIILAAGKSSRMGQPKFKLMMPEGVSFLDHIVRQYLDVGCEQIILVVNAEDSRFLTHGTGSKLDYRIVINEHAESSRLFSLQTGMNSTGGKGFFFIQNIDNPFASPNLLNLLYKNRQKADLIKPVYKGKGGHPVLISDKIAQDLLKLKDMTNSLRDFLASYQTFLLETDVKSILVNINTREELEKLYLV